MSAQKTIAVAGLLIAVTLMVTSVLALLQSSRTINNSGTIKAINVGIYLDSGCTQSVSSLTWGTLEPGTSAQKTIYVKNEGNTAMTLNMTTNTWSPANASTYITVTWNQGGSVVNAGNSVQANITLSVSQSINGITNFTFNIIISGTE